MNGTAARAHPARARASDNTRERGCVRRKRARRGPDAAAPTGTAVARHRNDRTAPSPQASGRPVGSEVMASSWYYVASRRVTGGAMAQTLSPSPGPVGSQPPSRGPVTGTAVAPAPACRRAPFVVGLYRSALGKKYVMAITGIVWMGYVLAHMVGNLKAFLGPEDQIDHYAEVPPRTLLGADLPPAPPTLWLMRLGLIAAGSCPSTIHAAHDADDHEPQGAARPLPEPSGLRGSDVREPHHALHGRARPAVPVRAPRRPDAGLVQPRLRSRRGVPEHGRQPLPVVG